MLDLIIPCVLFLACPCVHFHIPQNSEEMTLFCINDHYDVTVAVDGRISVGHESPDIKPVRILSPNMA